ncbi:MAG: acyltransferase [Chloroflexi bacterium HGW-Chloroflexi-8]|jgi:acetyltransferase-like isoleucine patch superfamily enzyme|nr:MAG: acyltransferase [Chloroflexi bacterium HGW-Chloroflexi-8]
MLYKNKIAKFIYVFSDMIIVPVVRFFQKILKRPLVSITRLFRHIFWTACLGGLGEDSMLSSHIVIHQPENVHIGCRSSLAEFVHIWGGGGVFIGDDVLIASHVVITSQTHDVYTNDLFRNTHLKRPVHIENNVWIGAGAIILPGVHISNGSIVGAGSIVNRDVPPHVCVAGVPAREIRKLV